MASASLLLRVAVTVAFAASGGYCLHRCVRRRPASVTTRLDDACHVLMTVLMVAALWIGPMPVGWSAAALALACGWFAARAVTMPTGRRSVGAGARAVAVPAGGRPVAGCGGAVGNHRGSRWRCVHHAVLMALSAWMLAVPALDGGSTMPGMRMPAGPVRVAAVGTAYCLVVSVWLLIAWARAPRRRNDLAHAVMAAGMGAMLAAMA